jgi:uncharacterized protein YuzB (UPF0349 family)
MKSIFVNSICLIFLVPSIWAQDFDTPLINPFSLTVEGARSSPYLIDMDNDGDPDLFTGYVSGDFGYYENTGTVNAPNFAAVIFNPFSLSELSGSCAPLLSDLDDDGDFDMMAGGSSGPSYFENQGSVNVPSFGPEITNPFGIIGPTGLNKPALVDIDNDNDLDLFVGSSDGNTYYYENTGTVNNPVFAVSQINPFGLSDVGSRSAPSFADLDVDGDLDVMIGNQSGQFSYFENIGNANVPDFSFVSENPFNLSSVGQDAKPNFADLDNDGDLDLISGNALGEYYYFENIAPLSIEDHNQQTYVIYPNPIREFAYIKLKDIVDKGFKLQVTDVSGRRISARKVSSENGIILFQREGLSNGLYLVYLEDEISRLFLGKILIE